MYDKPLHEKQQLEKSIRANLKNFFKTLKNNGEPIAEIPISVILSVMETEAWFLAEYHFLSKIDSRLTADFIFENCGFDLKSINVEEREHPTQDLKDIYKLIEHNYDKSEITLNEIIQSLDYESIYLHLVKNVKQLEKLITEIDTFLSLDDGEIPEPKSNGQKMDEALGKIANNNVFSDISPQKWQREIRQDRPLCDRDF